MKLGVRHNLELLEDFAKRWLAHDGIWFQAIEQVRGLDEAVERDIEAWRGFAVIEVKRIMPFLGLPKNGGLDALERAPKLRLYAFLNVQECSRPDDRTSIFDMLDCRANLPENKRVFLTILVSRLEKLSTLYSLLRSTLDLRRVASLAHQTPIQKNSIVDGRLPWTKNKY